MPRSSVNSVADRAQGSPVGMHPRRSGDLILTPDDALEGFGNFTTFDASGNPISSQNPEITAELVSPPVADAHAVLVDDTDPNATTFQNTSPIELSKASYLLNKPLVNGDPMPKTGDFLAKLPTPDPPTLKKVDPTIAGFPASTAQSPYWIGFAWGDKKKNYTMLSPLTSLQVAQGQSISATLPDLSKPPVGAVYLGVFLSEPGKSTVSRAGPMRLQRDIKLSNYSSGTYDLNGPYHMGRLAPTVDETSVGTPAKPSLRSNGHDISKPGVGVARITWVDAQGEGLPSPVSNSVTITGSQQIPNDPIAYQQQVRQNNYNYQQQLRQYQQQQSTSSGGSGGSPPQRPQDPILTQGDPTAGYGSYSITRPDPPPEATGWYPYLTIAGSESKVYDQKTDEGRSKPFSLKTKTVTTQGWQATDAYGLHNTYVLTGGSPPTQDGSAVQKIDSAPAQPVTFGAARPGPGTYYVRQVDLSDGVPSLPSDSVSITIGDYEIIRVVFSNPVNKLANGTYVEKGADGLPLDWSILTTNGSASANAGELSLGTTGAQSGQTPSATSDPVSVKPNQTWEIKARIEVAFPTSGALAGSATCVLQQFNSSGTLIQSNTLTTASSVGVYQVQQYVGPSQSITWNASVSTFNLIFAMSGVTKNITMKVSRGLKKPYKHKLRRYKKTKQTVGVTIIDPNPPPETTQPPGSDTEILPPPSPVEGPETFALDVSQFDRPLASGTVLESDNFNSGGNTGWTSNTSNATLAVGAGGAIAGAQGLRAQKASSGASAYAYRQKTFSPEVGLVNRHSLALSTRNQVASLGVNDYVEMHRLVRPSDNSLIAWLRYGNALEVGTLSIDTAPLYPGNVTITTDNGTTVTTTNVAVTAVQEIASLTVNSAPTSPGTVTVLLDNGSGNMLPYSVATGGTREEFTLRVTSRPTTTGYVTVNVAGTSFPIRVKRKDSVNTAASRIRNNSYPGWTVTGSGSYIYFSSDLPGARTDSTFSPGTTGMAATVTITSQGVSETPASLADRIRQTDFSPYWQAGGSTGTSTVSFTSQAGGPRVDAQFASGTVTWAGTPPTMSTTQQGTIDDANALAARIRGTSFSGYTVTGSANTITWTATSPGRRQPTSYTAGSTGASGTMTRVQVGLAGDITARCQDSSGVQRVKRIMTGLNTSKVWDVDVTVAGAGTTQGIVSFWGFVEGTTTNALLARFESVDLTGYPAGTGQVGVVADSGTSATWDVHIDDLTVTDRGISYYRDHDYSGNLLYQIYYHGVPQQPPGKFGLVGTRLAVLPGQPYRLSIFGYWDNLPTGTQPLLLTQYNTGGTSIPASTVGSNNPFTADGLSGSGGWTEFTYDFTPDPQVYEVGLDPTETVSSGLLVFQELVISPGSTQKRTPLYASSGNYAATLDTATPLKPVNVNWGRQRRVLSLDSDVPVGTSLVATYSAADIQAGPYVGATSDPTTLVDKRIARIAIGASGPGTATPVLKTGSPFTDYAVMLGPKQMGILLDEHFNELPGGTWFYDLYEWTQEDDIVTNELPGGRFLNVDVFPGVGRIDGAMLAVSIPETAFYIQKNIRKKSWGIEMYGERLLVRFGGPISLRRDPGTERVEDGQRYAVYSGSLPPAEILSRAPLP